MLAAPTRQMEKAMKLTRLMLCLLPATFLVACGGDEKTIVHEKPVVIQAPAPTSPTPVIIHDGD